MDANTLNRREKRHYRKVVDGEIVYSTSPVDDISEDYSDVKPDKIKVEKVVPTNISLDKKELMNKVLDNMSEVINPDMDSIADAIYEQLKENNIDVEKKVVKNVVTKHYRASTGTVTTNTSTDKESDEGFDSSIDRDKLKLVVDDLYVQIENENKTEELNKAKEKVVLENIKKEKDKEKEQPIKSKETSKKTKEQEKPVKKNDVSKLLQEDDLDLSDDEDSDDDLGLKF
ncbi:MAG: hypothetical protein WCF78_03695 [archaeon]